MSKESQVAVESVREEPQVVTKTVTFSDGNVLITLNAGMRITDERLIRQARAAMVSMLPESQSPTHARCPSCGHIFETVEPEAKKIMGLPVAAMASVLGRR